MSGSSPKIFISYRRQETAGHAGRLYDAMAARFGDEHVFVDVDLEPGVDFVQRIKNAIAASHVLLVIIGPQWARLTEEGSSAPRIADPDDFVRLEVETALHRPELTVIPLLVAGAQMPEAEELPEGLRSLAHRNALELSDMRWRYDVGRLNATLDELLADTSAVHRAVVVPEPPARAHTTARLVIDGMLVAGLAALVARWLADPIDPSDQSTDEAAFAVAVIRRTVVWALLGAALGAWLSYMRDDLRLIASRIALGLAIGALAGALGGLIQYYPQYLADLKASSDAVHAISIAAFAVSGALIGVLLGALWTPRSVGVGALAGLVAGALVRLVWNALDWQAASSFEEALGIGIQCLLIVGFTLAALQLVGAQRTSAIVGAGHGPQGAG